MREAGLAFDESTLAAQGNRLLTRLLREPARLFVHPLWLVSKEGHKAET
jgi:hypothetical protein